MTPKYQTVIIKYLHENRKYTLVLDTFFPVPENPVLLPLRYFLPWKFVADYNLNIKLMNKIGIMKLN